MKRAKEEVAHYREHGYVVVGEFFPRELAVQMRDPSMMALCAEGPKAGDFGGTLDPPDDPTPPCLRFIQRHCWGDRSKEWATASGSGGIPRPLRQGGGPEGGRSRNARRASPSGSACGHAHFVRGSRSGLAGRSPDRWTRDGPW